MIIRTLVALAALFLIGTLMAKTRWAWLFGVALAVPLAFLTYGVLGIDDVEERSIPPNFRGSIVRRSCGSTA